MSHKQKQYTSNSDKRLTLLVFYIEYIHESIIETMQSCTYSYLFFPNSLHMYVHMLFTTCVLNYLHIYLFTYQYVVLLLCCQNETIF